MLSDGDKTPLGVIIAPADQHEVRHIERLLDSAVVVLPATNRLLYGIVDLQHRRRLLHCSIHTDR